MADTGVSRFACLLPQNMILALDPTCVLLTLPLFVLHTLVHILRLQPPALLRTAARCHVSIITGTMTTATTSIRIHRSTHIFNVCVCVFVSACLCVHVLCVCVCICAFVCVCTLTTTTLLGMNHRQLHPQTPSPFPLLHMPHSCRLNFSCILLTLNIALSETHYHQTAMSQVTKTKSQNNTLFLELEGGHEYEIRNPPQAAISTITRKPNTDMP